MYLPTFLLTVIFSRSWCSKAPYFVSILFKELHLIICYGLNICVPLEFIYWNPNAPDGVGRWGLWEVTGLEGGALMNRTSSLIRKHMRAYSFSLLFPPREDTVKAPVCNPEEGPYQILTMLASWSQTSSLQNWEISVAY